MTEPLDLFGEPVTTKKPKSLFLQFWAAYPNHQRKVAQAKCCNLWNAQGLDRVSGQILEGLERWKDSDEWTREDGAYICQPHRWLNERRWELTVTPAKSSRAKANEWDKLGEATHRALFEEVKRLESNIDHRPGSILTQRAMRRIARAKGLL